MKEVSVFEVLWEIAQWPSDEQENATQNAQFQHNSHLVSHSSIHGGSIEHQVGEEWLEANVQDSQNCQNFVDHVIALVDVHVLEVLKSFHQEEIENDNCQISLFSNVVNETSIYQADEGKNS